jgi:hypothetical protein
LRPKTEGARLERLRRSLSQWLNTAGIRVEAYREGVDCWVDRVTLHQQASAVARSAKVERAMTRYEGLVDFGEGLEKEVAVVRLLRDAGVPTPAVLAWHRTTDADAEPSWMLLEYVPHDPLESLIPDAQMDLGRVARRIHGIRPSGHDRFLLRDATRWSEWIAARISMRIEAAAYYISIPDRTQLERILRATFRERDEWAVSLLHLDLRPPNLAIQNNRIVAVFDLANSIAGDPWLELGRIRGCGLLTPAFLKGYGLSGEQIEQNRNLLDAYELDLAALLVVVSREEMIDEALHDRMGRRTIMLIEQLLREYRGVA